MAKVTYQIATRNGYDCEEIKTREDAVAFLRCAKERALGSLCVYIDGVLSACLKPWDLRAMTEQDFEWMARATDTHGVIRDLVSGEVA